MAVVSINVVSAPGTPDRTNEDGWVAVEDRTPPGRVAAAVIDGASVRGLLPSLAAYVSEQGYGPKPAVWATTVVRSALYRAFTAEPPVRPDEALIAANETLRSALEMVPGMAEVYAILARRPVEPLPEALTRCTEPLASDLRALFSSLFPAGRWRLLDTRYLRLMLPACVATAIRLNLSSGTFDFAHVGDTALLLVDAMGMVRLLSEDQMEAFDNMALEIALKSVRQEDNQIRTVGQAIQMVPGIRETNRLNGLRHNYVDERGHTQAGEGCGVLDGLPEMNRYVQTGEGMLASGDRLYLMSDGLTLPLSHHAEALPPLVKDALTRWQQALQDGDVLGLLSSLRIITEADDSKDIFPRLKQHDDATGLLVAWY